MSTTNPRARQAHSPVAAHDLYVYAITTAAAAGAELGPGIDARPVHVLTGPGDLAAVVHDHDGQPYQGADDDVRRWVLEHSDVVDRTAAATDAVLPVSFNVIVANQERDPAAVRLQRWLEENAATLGERLRQLHQRVELRLEIALVSAVVARDHPEAKTMRAEAQGRPAGVQRLLSKRLEQRERQWAEQLADRLYPEYRRRLAPLAEDLVENRSSRPGPGQVPVLSFAVLVPGDRTEAVGRELARIQAEEPAARIRFLGPWPPYSFADLPEVTPTEG